jgi:PAS domain S-box-containing protein
MSAPLLTSATLTIDRRLLDALPIMVWFDNAEGHCIYLNQAASTYTGRPFDREAGLAWQECIQPADRASYDAQYRKARATASPFEIEYRLRRHDGEFRWVLERGHPMFDERGALLGYAGFCLDTTERRAVDAVRHEMEEQVRVLGLATRDWVWSWDVRTERVIHNGAFTEALGEAPGPRAATQAWWQQRVHPADLSRVMGTFHAAVRAGRDDVASEYRIRKRGGSYAHVEDRVCFVRDSHGAVVRVLGAMRDITERKRVAEAHARFTKILESTSDFVGMTSAGGLVLYLNAAGRELLGWPPDRTVAGVHFSTLVPAWVAEIIFEEGIPLAIREGTWAGETALLHADGREIPVSQVIISHRNAEGDLEFLSTIIRDISERKREEVARIEWANRYDAAIRASGQVLFDWDSASGEITYAGDLPRLIGYGVEEMAGGLDRLRSLIVPEDLPAFDEQVQHVIATRDPFQHAFRVIHRGGRTVHIEAKGYFFLDRLGQIGRMVGFFADITAQRLAEAELARAQEGLEARVAERTAELAQATELIQARALQTETVAQLGQRALAGMPVQDLLDDAARLVRQTLRVDFVSILELNPEGSRLIAIADDGWPTPERGWAGVGHESQSGYTLLTGEPVIVEDASLETRFRISPYARDCRAVSSISVVIESNQAPHGVLIAFTKTRRAFTQDDVNFLQSMANVLTTSIDRRRAEESIRAAQAQAEAANRAKSEFLSRMSHELRTPLNAIIGFSQILEIEQPTPRQAESISHISQAGQHLLALINEVLDIARIETGRLALSPEPLETSSFLQQAVELIRPLAQRHEIDVVLDPSAQIERHVLADHQRLKQVLLNLLSNAVKYNRPHGHVLVACTPASGRLRIQVTDTGLGIPPEKQERLFVPFERLGAEATGIEGTGLGLALAQRIIQALDGQLGYETTMGEGSTFWIELPTAFPPEPVPTGHDAPAAPTTRKLLYIEDQDLNLRLVERILSHRPGCQLIPAMQGRLALDLAREHQPDVILLDLNLPDMNGEEVLRRLKADPSVAHIPVVMISADALGDRINTLLELGARGYLTKPYKLQEFLAVLEEAMRA